MQKFFFYVSTFLVICFPTAIVIFAVWKGHSQHDKGCSKHPNEHELERRKYETMLRHRRRAKLEKQFCRHELQG